MSETPAMPRCETCQFWQRIPHDDAYRLGELMPRDDDYQPIDDGTLRFCTSPKVRFFEAPDPDGAAVIDGSEYWGAFVTRAAFGCVHHAPSSPSEPS